MSCAASAPRREAQAPRQSLPSLGRQARTIAMWQRDGCKDAPENNPEVSAAAARTTRHCFNDPGYRGPLPTP